MLTTELTDRGELANGVAGTSLREHRQILQRIEGKVDHLLVQQEYQGNKVLLASSLAGGMSGMVAAIFTVGLGYIKLMQGKI